MIYTMTQNHATKSVCDMCGESINDRYYLLVGSRKLHNECLTCRKCSVSLSADSSCYEKEEMIYCKTCYFRLFSITKCNGCNIGLSSTDLVMQANDSYYHVNCFRCTLCSHLLQKGEKFGVRNLKLFCEEHYMESVCRRRTMSNNNNNNNSVINNNNSSINSFNMSDHHEYNNLHHNHHSNNIHGNNIHGNHHHGNNNGNNGNDCYNPDPHKSYRNISLDDADSMELKTSLALIGEMDGPLSDSLNLPRLSPYSAADGKHHGLLCGNDQMTDKELTSLNPMPASLVLDQLPKIPSIRSSPTMSEMTKSMSSSGSSDEEMRDGNSTASDTTVGKSKRGKPKRVRTTFKHYQLIAMKELFDVDKNPDSKALTELSEKVDLSKRVLQVWFQNARAKQRKGQSIFSESVEKLLSPASEEKSRSKNSNGGSSNGDTNNNNNAIAANTNNNNNNNNSNNNSNSNNNNNINSNSNTGSNGNSMEIKNEPDFLSKSSVESGFGISRDSGGYAIKTEPNELPFSESKLVFSNT